MRPLHLALILGMGVATAGCGHMTRDAQQALLDYKNQARFELEWAKTQIEFLNKKVVQVEEKLDQAARLDAQVNRDMAYYQARPDEIKREILREVDERAQELQERRSAFEAQLASDLDARVTAYDDSLVVRRHLIHDELDYNQRFVDFVMSSQDSINREFAYRFDSRPWYENVIGSWDSKPSEDN